LLNRDPRRLNSALKRTVRILEGMYLLAKAGGVSSSIDTILPSISLVASVTRNVKAAGRITVRQLRGIVSIIEYLRGSLPPLDVQSPSMGWFSTDPDVSHAYVRGGVLANYTALFSEINPTIAETIRSSIVPISPFDSYIVVGNGMGGSTSNTFLSTASSYAKKYAGTVTPLITVSFGGNGKKEDCPLTQYAGGQVDSVDFTSYYYEVAYGLIYSQLAPPSSDVSEYTDTFMSMLPQPPMYFPALPRFTRYEIYPKVFGNGTLPLEYFNFGPDAYIKAWYWNVSWSSFQSSQFSDLMHMWSNASFYFR